MNDIMRDVTSVAMAIIGVAILAVIVSNKNNTTGVLGAASSGFGNVLSIAMGGAAGASTSMSGA
jgi:threonine/homoserine efflux transporter RhtA